MHRWIASITTATPAAVKWLESLPQFGASAAPALASGGNTSQQRGQAYSVIWLPIATKNDQLTIYHKLVASNTCFARKSVGTLAKIWHLGRYTVD